MIIDFFITVRDNGILIRMAEPPFTTAASLIILFECVTCYKIVPKNLIYINFCKWLIVIR